jgi:hypothetical protein
MAYVSNERYETCKRFRLQARNGGYRPERESSALTRRGWELFLASSIKKDSQRGGALLTASAG